MGASAGSIQRIKSYSLPLSAECGPYSYGHLAAADVNGDGRVDIAFSRSVPNTGASGCHAEWGVLLNQGNGTFRLTSGPSAVGSASTSGSYIALGDFNRDGHMDVVVGAASEGTFHMFFGNGDGTFSEHALPPHYPISSIADIDVADTNGDGFLDLAVVDGQGYGALIYVGDGAGNFVNVEEAPSNNVANGLRLADLDNNGTVDVVMVSVGRGYDVAVNDGHGNFSERPGVGNSTTFSVARVGDLNGDGLVDLVTTTIGTAINVQTNRGSYPYFNPATALETGSGGATALRLPDFDGDGKRDILAGIVGGPSGADIALFSNSGNGNFSAPSYFTTGLASTSNSNQTIDDLLVRDFDGDGKIDIAALGPNELAVFVAPPDRIFRNGFEIATSREE